VFLKIQDASRPKLEFGGGNGGGILTPNLQIGGISRSLGPVGGTLDTARQGKFDPQEFFKGVEAKILGGLDLFELIKDVALSGDSVPSEAMKLSYRTRSMIPIPGSVVVGDQAAEGRLELACFPERPVVPDGGAEGE